MKELINKCLSVLLSVAMVLTMGAGSLSMVFAEDAGGNTSSGDTSYLMINGNKAETTSDGNKFTVNYGDQLKLSWNNAESANVQVKPEGASDEQYKTLKDGRVTLTPGNYDIHAYLTDKDSKDTELSYKLAVNKAVLSSPADPQWKVSSSGSSETTDLTWEPVKYTSTNNNDDVSDAVASYHIEIYKDGQQFKTLNSNTNSYSNISNSLDSAGKYSFKVRAVPKDSDCYQESAEAEGPEYLVVKASIEKGSGISEASFGGASDVLLMAGYSGREITASSKDNYKFSGWSCQENGVKFDDPSKADTNVSIPKDYRGSTTITLKASARDTKAPEIGAFTAGKSQDGNFNDQLTAKAADGDSGIASYSFSTEKNGSSVSNWTEVPGSPTDEQSFSIKPEAAGNYYFYVKDKDGNISRSETSVPVTKVTYENLYKDGQKTSESDLFTGSDYTLRDGKDFTRGAYDFAGLYKDGGFSAKAPEKITEADPANGYTFYVKWDKQSVSFVKDLDKAVTEEYGKGGVTLSVSVANSGNTTYQWYKDGKAVEGATGTSLTLNHVSDSGKYYVKAVLENGDSGDSTACTVTIQPKPIVVKAEDKKVTYGEAAPEYSYSVSPAGDRTTALENGDSLEGTAEYDCSYSQGGNAGSYDIKVKGLSNPDYSIQFETGKLKVQPLDLSDRVTLTLPDSSQFDYTYDPDKEKKPAVQVMSKDGSSSMNLVQGTDYDVSYSNNKNANGEKDPRPEAKVTFKGNYTGAAAVNFDIAKGTFKSAVQIQDFQYHAEPAAPSLSSNVSGGKVTYYFKKSGEPDSSYSTSAPVNGGKYTVYALIAGTNNYNQVKTDPVDFQIKPVEITIHTSSNTWSFDGYDHQDLGYRTTGDFVGSDGFSYVKVTGTIRNTGTTDNTVTYAFKDGVHPENYNIVQDLGKLTVNARTLPVPSNTKWEKAGKASWTGIVRDGLEVSYRLNLYAAPEASEESEGTAEKPVLVNSTPIETSETTYDFSELIRKHAEDHPEDSYYFTIQTISKDGENKDNYIDSKTSDKVGDVYTATLNIKAGEGISSASSGANKSTRIILISGESAPLSASVKDGYTFSGWALSQTGGLTIGNENKTEASVTASDLHSSVKDAVVMAQSTDDAPVIGSFTAENSQDLKSVRLKFSASDVIGLSGWMITDSPDKPSAGDSRWQAVPNQMTSYSGYQDVSTKGKYYLYVKDTGGNITGGSPVSVYGITLNPGEGSGEEVTLLKSEHSTVKLPSVPFTKADYAFQNWKGGTGIYTDGGAYSADSDDTLTAQWTNEIFQYTVKYYEMGTDGKYSSEPAEEKTYSALANTTVKYDDSSISLRKEGFSLASDNNGAEQKITLHENGDVLNVYYSRNKYQITYKYKPAGQSDYKIKDVVTKYYGEDISKAFADSTKPSEDGYSFNGWILSDTGDGDDSLMPARDITAIGSFSPKQTTYKIVYYEQGLKDGDGTGETAAVSDQYGLDESRTVSRKGTQGDQVSFGKSDAPKIDGFTFAGYKITQGSAAGSEKPSDLSDSVTGTVSAADGKQTVINCYYTRNTYNMNLDVVESNNNSNTTLYSKSWKVPYGAAVDSSYYSNYNKEEWGNKASSGAALLDYTGWSTGSPVSSMPAGDVTVTKRYSADFKVPYKVEVYLEDDSDSATPSFTKASTFQYYGADGQTVTVGPDSSDTVDYDSSSKGFAKFIPFFNYYELDKDNAGNKLSTKLSADSTGDSGSNTLKVYFQRKEMPVTINYYYKDSEHSGRTELATVTKKIKWGYNHKYDPEALAYFDGGDPEFKGTTTSVNVKDEDKAQYDFKSGEYVVSYDSYYVLDYDQHYGTYKYDSVDSLTKPQSVAAGYSGNTINVYYVKTDPPKMYYLDVDFQTSNVTGHSGTPDQQLTYDYDGTTYKVRVASDAYFYKDVKFSSDGDFTQYPGLKNTITGNNKYQYSTDSSNLKDGYQKVTIGSYTCYLHKGDSAGDNYLYVADPENRFFQGNPVTYTFPEDAPGYSTVQKFVSDHQNKSADTGHDKDMDNGSKRLAVWSRGYGLATTYGSGDKLLITLYYKDPIYLLYSYGGATCYEHPYSQGDTVTEISCPHLERNNTGYTTYWYTDAAHTKRAKAPFTIEETTTLYGNYEHKIFENTERAYYQLTAPAVQNGKEYDYITENDLSAFGSDVTTKTKDVEQTVTTDTGNETRTVKEKDYYYKNQLVMKELPVYARSYQTLSMDTGDTGSFGAAGFHFDQANSSNNTSGYVTGDAVSLQAYYARNKHQLQIDRKNDTAAESREALSGQSVDLAVPTRDGYQFSGWKLYEKSSSDEREETGEASPSSQWTALSENDAADILKKNSDNSYTLTMADKDLKAEAQWTPVSFDQRIFHYYQGVDGSYQEEKVQTLASQKGTPKAFTIDGKAVDGVEYKNGSGTVYALGVTSKDGKTTTFYDPGSGTDPYDTRTVNCIGAVEEFSPVSEASVALADHQKNIDGYSFSQAVYQHKDNFQSWTDLSDASVSASYGMELSYYYSLVRGIQVRGQVAVANGAYSDKAGSISSTGSFYYSEKASINVTAGEGYDFAGWYKASDVLKDYDSSKPLGHELIENYSQKTPLTTDKTLQLTVTGPEDLAAVVKARAAAKPEVAVKGIDSLTYGYGDDSDRVLKASVEFPEGTESANKVSAYQWFCNGQAIEGADSANYVIPVGKDAGEYKYTCQVTVTRSDNGQQLTADSDTHTVTVSPAEISTEAEARNYSGEYDGQSHSAQIVVTNVKDSGDYTIYYSSKELTAGNYSKEGSTENPAYKNVNVQDGKRIPYTVYYYIKSNNSNYSDTHGSATVDIKPVPLTLSGTTSTYEKTYDGSPKVSGTATDKNSDLGKLVQGGSYKINGILGSEKMTAHIIDCTATYDHPDVDTATSVTLSDIRLMYKDSSTSDYKYDYNYVFKDSYSISMPASIKPCLLKLDWSSTDNIIYDGTPKLPSAVISNKDKLPDGDYLDVKVQGQQVNAGSYTAAANIVLEDGGAGKVNLDNYAIDNGSLHFEIKKRPVTIMPEDVAVDYDGKSHTLTEFTVDEKTPLVEGHKFQCEEDQARTEAGTYKLSPKNTRILDSNGDPVTSNYSITEAEGTLTINKKAVTVSGIKADDKTYNGTDEAQLDLSGVKIIGASDGQKLTLDPSKVHGTFVQSGAGDNVQVNITFDQDALTGFDGTDVSNYSLDVDHSQKTAAANINKKVITVKAKDNSATYGDTKPKDAFAATFSGFAENEDESLISGKDQLSYTLRKTGESSSSSDQAYSGETGAGNYNIIPDVSKLSADNYKFESDNSGIMTVSKRPVTLTGKGAVTKTYDGKNRADITKDNYRFGNLVNGDELELHSWNSTFDDKNAGEGKTVTVKDATIDSDNYVLPGDQSTFTLTNCTINKRILTITANNTEITYGAESNPQYSAEFKGFADGESQLGGSDLTMSGSGVTGSGQSSAVSPVFSCKYDCKDPGNRDAGTYEITAGGLSSNNYQITYIPGTLTVAKKELTLKPVTKQDSYTYGSQFVPENELTCSTSGLAYGDTAEKAFSAKLAYSVNGLGTTADNNISSPAGNYTVNMTVSDFSSKNYTETPETGTVIVNKKSLTISGFSVADRVYDGTAEVHRGQITMPEFNTTNYQGLQSFDEDYGADSSHNLTKDNAVTVTGLYPDGKDVSLDKDGTVKDKGAELTIKLGDYLAGRYQLTTDKFQTSGKITRRPLKITAEDKTIKYGEPAPQFTAAFGPVNSGSSDEGLIEKEKSYVSSSNVVMEAPDYKEGDNVTSESGTTTASYPINVRDFSSNDVNVDNYAVTYVKGSLSVEKNQLEAPKPVWNVKSNSDLSNDKAGTVSWKAVDGIHGIGVDKYKISLYKDGTLVDGSVHEVPAGTLSYNYTDKMTEAGKYTVKVQAIATTDGNRNPTNVLDSGEGQSDSLYAANVTFEFAGDAVTSSGKGGSITINGGDHALVIAGQKNIPVTAELKNGTGYRVKSVTGSADAISVTNGDSPDKDRNGSKYESTFSMKPSLETDNGTITIALQAVPAEVKLSLSIRGASKTGDRTGDITYGYTTSPVITAVPEHEGEYKDYTYEYTFKLHDQANTTVSGPDSSNQYTFPSGKTYAINRYWIEGSVTATRKDNGEKATASTGDRSRGAVTINVLKGKYAPEIKDYSGWTYGESRVVPTAEKNITELRESPEVTFQFKKHGEPDTAFSQVIPKDAGQYDMRAVIGETSNYNEMATPAKTFTISKGKLDTPSGLTSQQSDGSKTNYGKVSWNTVKGVQENGGVNPDSKTDIWYKVTLEKKDQSSGEWKNIKTYDDTQSDEMNIGEDLQADGDYRFSVQAVTKNNAANCDNSDIAVSDVFRVGGKITASGSGKTDQTGQTYTQMYDSAGVTLKAETPESGEKYSYQWYRDGKAIDAAVSSTLNVRNVKDSGYYTCKITSESGTFSSPFMNVVINKRPVELKADSKSAAYGSSIDDTGQTVGTLSYTDSGQYKLVDGDKDSLGITLEARAKDGKAMTVSSSTRSGEYDIVIGCNKSSDAAGNYDIELADGKYTIHSLVTDARASVDGTRGNNGWFTSDVVLTAPNGYSISTELDGQYEKNLTISNEGKSQIKYYLKRDGDGGKTDAISEARDKGGDSLVSEVNIDKTSAEGTIKIRNSIFTKLLNTITFGLFFKDTVQAQITSADNVSGMASTKYYKADKQMDPSVLTSDQWTEGTTVSLAPNEKAVVYARLEDKAGHVTYLSSEGLVMYTDGSQDTKETTYTRTSPDGAKAVVNTNGNTVSAVSVNGKTLNTEDYRVTYDADGRKAYIELLNGYLKNLAAGEYKAEVTYDPMGVSGTIRRDDLSGEDGSKTAFSDNQLPVTTIFTLKVVKAQPVVDITGDPSGVYNGKAVEAPVYQVSYPHEKADGTFAKLTYYSLGEDGSRTKLDGAPVTAGKYVAVATRDEDRDYLPASGEKQFTISKKDIQLKGDSAHKTYDGKPLVNGSYSLAEGTSLAEGDSIEGLKMEGTSRITNVGSVVNKIDSGSVKIIRNSDKEDVTSSYNVVLINDGNKAGKLTVDPAAPTIVMPEGTGENSLTYTAKLAEYKASVVLPVLGETSASKITYQYSTDGGSTYKDGLPAAAGDYLIRASIPADGNYTEAQAAAPLTIRKKAVTIKLDDQSKIYGDRDPALTYKVENDLKDDPVKSEDLQITRTPGEKAGEYQITGTAAPKANSNYSYNFVPASGKDEACLTINKKAVTITAEDKSKFYGEKDPVLTFKAEGDLENDKVSDSDIALTRAQGEEAGSYKITASARDGANSNYSYSFAEGTMTITYIPGDSLTLATIVPEGNTRLSDNGSDKFYNGPADLVPPEGYLISFDKDKDYSDSLKISKEGASSFTYYLKDKKTGAVSEPLSKASRQKADGGETVSQINIDTTSPSGSIKSGVLDLINRLFFKDKMTVTFAASDENGSLKTSGIKSIEYQKAGKDQPAGPDGSWTKIHNGGSITISASDESRYYARITDCAGNVTIINSDNEVVYKDSIQKTDKVVYTRTTGEDKTAEISVSGNTIKSVNDGNRDLNEGADYTLSYSDDRQNAVITLKGSYLETKAASEKPYNLTVSYDPMGYEDGVRYSDDQRPETTRFQLVVKKAAGSVSGVKTDSKTYDGKPCADPEFRKTGTGAVTVEYHQVADGAGNPVSGTGFTSEKPVNAGTYEVRVAMAENGDYTGAESTGKLTISRRPVAVKVVADSKTYDGNRKAALNGSIETGVEGQTISISGLTGTFGDKNAGTAKKIQVDSSNAAAKGGAGTDLANYSIKYPGEISTGEIRPKDITVAYSTKTKVYDGKPDADVTATIETGVEGEEIYISGLKGIFDSPDAGKDKAVSVSRENETVVPGKGTDLANYKFHYPDGSTGEIERKDIAGAHVVLGNLVRETGEEQTQEIKSVVIDGLDVTYDVSGNTAASAGSHKMRITGNGNFKGEVPVTWAIAAGDENIDKLGKIQVDVKVEPGAPDTTMNSSKASVVQAAATAGELSSVAEGDRLDIWLVVKDISETIKPEPKAELDKTAEVSGMTAGQYFDVSMFRKLASEDKETAVTSTRTPVSVTIAIPEGLINRNTRIRRSYMLIRYYEGVAEVMPAVYDSGAETLTFETDKFSEYAIAYSDTLIPEKASSEGYRKVNMSSLQGVNSRKNPKTGDTNTSLNLWMLIFGTTSALAGALGITGKKRREQEDASGNNH